MFKKSKITHVNIRHLHIGFGEPCVADPMGMVQIIETGNRRDPVSHEAINKRYWTGWRAKLLNKLVNWLLPLHGYTVDTLKGDYGQHEVKL